MMKTTDAHRRLWALLFMVAAAASAATVDETRLLVTLKKTHPGTHFTEVLRTPIAGLYEVWMNDNLAYVASSNPRYLIFGRVFDTQAMRDITAPKLVPKTGDTEEVRRVATATVAQLAPIVFEQLPLLDAIKTVRGNGQRKVAVFSDPNCGYCKQLEPELAGIDNITVYTFMLPFFGEAKPVAIWCAPDRVQAWQAWMLKGDSALLSPSATCTHPIARNLALAHQLGVQGTPTLIWSDGHYTQGYLSRSELEAQLALSSKEARR